MENMDDDATIVWRESSGFLLTQTLPTELRHPPVQELPCSCAEHRRFVTTVAAATRTHTHTDAHTLRHGGLFNQQQLTPRSEL